MQTTRCLHMAQEVQHDPARDLASNLTFCTPATLGFMCTPTSGLCTIFSLHLPSSLPRSPIPGSGHSHLNLSRLLREAFPHHTKGARAQLAPLHRPALFSSLHLPHSKLFTYFLNYGLPPVRTDIPGGQCLSAFTQI